MLFELGALVLSLLLPIGVIGAYRLGLRDGKAVKENAPIAPIAVPFFKEKPKPTQRIDKIMDNINAYDGTGRGQVDV